MLHGYFKLNCILELCLRRVPSLTLFTACFIISAKSKSTSVFGKESDTVRSMFSSEKISE